LLTLASHPPSRTTTNQSRRKPQTRTVYALSSYALQRIEAGPNNLSSFLPPPQPDKISPHQLPAAIRKDASASMPNPPDQHPLRHTSIADTPQQIPQHRRATTSASGTPALAPPQDDRADRRGAPNGPPRRRFRRHSRPRHLIAISPRSSSMTRPRYRRRQLPSPQAQARLPLRTPALHQPWPITSVTIFSLIEPSAHLNEKVIRAPKAPANDTQAALHRFITGITVDHLLTSPPGVGPRSQTRTDPLMLNLPGPRPKSSPTPRQVPLTSRPAPTGPFLQLWLCILVASREYQRTLRILRPPNILAPGGGGGLPPPPEYRRNDTTAPTTRSSNTAVLLETL